MASVIIAPSRTSVVRKAHDQRVGSTSGQEKEKLTEVHLRRDNPAGPPVAQFYRSVHRTGKKEKNSVRFALGLQLS